MSTGERPLERVSGGAGQALLVSGAAGIGKTRLAAEAAARGARLGFRVLGGRCFQQDRMLPYALSLTSCRHTGETCNPGTGPAVGPVGPRPGQAAARAGGLHAGPCPSGRDRKRVLQASPLSGGRAIILALTAGGPSLVVFEDIHWRNETSLDLPLYLPRNIASHPLLLLTYHGDEVSPSLAHFLAELDRLRLVTELPLVPLSIEEVEGMLQALFPSAPTALRRTLS